MIKQLPNMITMTRFIGLIVATYFLFLGGKGNTTLSFWLYFYVAWSDILDGYLARKFNAISAFGKLMDPIADKAYILTLYFSFAFLELISFWWGVAIAVREIGVTVIRIVLIRYDQVIAAEKSGKLKAFIQNLSLLFLFILYFNLHFWEIESNLINVAIAFLAYAFLVAAVVLTVYSGVEFLRRNLANLITKLREKGFQ